MKEELEELVTFNFMGQQWVVHSYEFFMGVMSLEMTGFSLMGGLLLSQLP